MPATTSRNIQMVELRYHVSYSILFVNDLMQSSRRFVKVAPFNATVIYAHTCY